MVMSLEEEMHHEVTRLEKEIEEIDMRLKKLHDKVFYLIELREKKGHDLKTLKSSFNETYAEDIDLEKIMKGREKVKI